MQRLDTDHSLKRLQEEGDVEDREGRLCHVVVTVTPTICFLDNSELVKVVTGGRTARTLWDWNADGLPIHQRGEGSAARHFILVRELETFLLDTSRVI